MNIKIESAVVSGLELPEFSIYRLSEGIQGLSKALEWCHDDSSFPSEASLKKAALQLGYALTIMGT